jgi:hypothetical protein
MKTGIILCISSLLVFNCSSEKRIIKLKDFKRIDGVIIGMPVKSAIDKVNRNYYVEKTEIPAFEGENKVFEYIVYTDKTKRTVLFGFNGGYDNQTKDKVFRLVIKNSRYHTIDGIYIGMTVKELKEKTKLKSVDFNYDDGLFIKSDRFDGGFLMDFDTIKDLKYINDERPKISTLPDGLKIKEIILF